MQACSVGWQVCIIISWHRQRGVVSTDIVHIVLNVELCTIRTKDLLIPTKNIVFLLRKVWRDKIFLWLWYEDEPAKLDWNWIYLHLKKKGGKKTPIVRLTALEFCTSLTPRVPYISSQQPCKEGPAGNALTGRPLSPSTSPLCPAQLKAHSFVRLRFN